MANILMGLAGPLPSDAPEAVRLLRRMVPEDADATPFPNFGAYVEHLIKEAAAPRSIVGSVSNPYRLVMCFNPPLAYREESRGQSHTFFSPTWGGKLPEMYRVTHISSNLIATAAGLAADQGKSASTQLPFRPSQVPARAPETKTAMPCQGHRRSSAINLPARTGQGQSTARTLP